MNKFWETVVTIAVLGGILVLSAVITNLFTHAMYIRCAGCNTLNAKRRSHCRICANDLRRSANLDREGS